MICQCLRVLQLLVSRTLFGSLESDIKLLPAMCQYGTTDRRWSGVGGGTDTKDTISRCKTTRRKGVLTVVVHQSYLVVAHQPDPNVSHCPSHYYREPVFTYILFARQQCPWTVNTRVTYFMTCIHRRANRQYSSKTCSSMLCSGDLHPSRCVSLGCSWLRLFFAHLAYAVCSGLGSKRGWKSVLDELTFRWRGVRKEVSW